MSVSKNILVSVRALSYSRVASEIFLSGAFQVIWLLMPFTFAVYLSVLVLPSLFVACTMFVIMFIYEPKAKDFEWYAFLFFFYVASMTGMWMISTTRDLESLVMISVTTGVAIMVTTFAYICHVADIDIGI